MKKYLLLIALFALPLSSFATYQIANPTRGAATKEKTGNLGYPQRYANTLKAQVNKGTLQENVQRIAEANGWKVVWQIKKNLPVLLTTQLAGANFVEVMNQLLNHYPLEASYRYDFKKHGKTLIVSDGS